MQIERERGGERAVSSAWVWAGPQELYGEGDGIPDRDRAPLDDLPERPAAPVRAQRGAESRLRFVHPLAWGDLAVDADEALGRVGARRQINRALSSRA